MSNKIYREVLSSKEDGTLTVSAPLIVDSILPRVPAPGWVQVINGKAVAEFEPHEILVEEVQK